jgi:hypothetical protein
MTDEVDRPTFNRDDLFKSVEMGTRRKPWRAPQVMVSDIAGTQRAGHPGIDARVALTVANHS